jgi:TfoX/Sxy family transcriptional regulator of competence genes
VCRVMTCAIRPVNHNDRARGARPVRRSPVDLSQSPRFAASAPLKIPKPTDEDRELFRSLVPDGEAIEVKPMFGNLGAFVNGHMFMGLFGSDIGLRLPPADAAELGVVEGAGPFGPTERPMTGYVAVPVAWRTTPDRLQPWIDKAVDHARRLPPKDKSKKKSRAG